MLERIFLQVINMSYIASIVIVFIIVARLLLAKAPKKYSYILWTVAHVRLIVPISFESVLSLVPVNPTPISKDVLYDILPNINTGMRNIDQSISGSLPAADVVASVNPMQVWIFIGSLIWILGIAILLIYGMVSLIRMKGKLKNANCEKDNIYQSDNVTTPFVLGLIQPKIYLPVSLSESEKEYILLHEQTHIKRLDHIIRFISYLVLCIHWFNPLVWIVFWLSGKDMEMSCDESVINQLGYRVKKDYSQSLLNLATSRTKLGLTPLTFGEGDTKGRVKNILNYKMPKFWGGVFICVLLIIMGIGFTTNPKVSSHFSMTGNRLSDLQPLEISQTIGDSVGSDFSEIIVTPDNFGLIVSTDFSFVKSEAVRFLYDISDESCKAAQLRIFIEDSEFFITDSTEWVTPKEQIYHLYTYFEALKYLPQEAIWAMTNEKPQRYAIKLSSNNNKYNEGRQIYYNKRGMTENNGWQIRLDIQPLYGTEDSSYHGIGNDIIHVYYSGSEL